MINLGLTKSGQRMGAAESVSIEDGVIQNMVRAWKLTALPGDPLYPAGPVEFRKNFAELLKQFGLDTQEYKPYSLRRGGATHHFRVHGSLSLTTLRGRWSAEKTARIYINDGLAMLAELTQSRGTISQVRKYLERFHTVTRCPAF